MVRAAIESETYEVDGSPLRITVSIGVASFPAEPFATAGELAKAADRRLNAAKERGRNRVVF
jgi:diguanylate cyclase (GGDEF)-like protein